jgi:hypothetical protein
VIVFTSKSFLPVQEKKTRKRNRYFFIDSFSIKIHSFLRDFQT